MAPCPRVEEVGEIPYLCTLDTSPKIGTILHRGCIIALVSEPVRRSGRSVDNIHLAMRARDDQVFVKPHGCGPDPLRVGRSS